jgi:hypothetical protein
MNFLRWVSWLFVSKFQRKRHHPTPAPPLEGGRGCELIACNTVNCCSTKYSKLNFRKKVKIAFPLFFAETWILLSSKSSNIPSGITMHVFDKIFLSMQSVFGSCSELNNFSFWIGRNRTKNIEKGVKTGRQDNKKIHVSFQMFVKSMIWQPLSRARH